MSDADDVWWPNPSSKSGRPTTEVSAQLYKDSVDSVKDGTDATGLAAIAAGQVSEKLEYGFCGGAGS